MTSMGDNTMGDVFHPDNQPALEDFTMVDESGDRNRSPVDSSRDLLESESGRRDAPDIESKNANETHQTKEILDVKEDRNVGTRPNAENAAKHNVEIPGPNSSPHIDFDNNLPPTVKLLTTPNGGKLYLIGTAHYSLQSQEDVSTVIQAVQPHTVSIELCRNRVHILTLDEETILREVQDINMNKMWNIIKNNGFVNGITNFLIMYSCANLAKTLGVAPGGEFRRAFLEANKVPNCKVHLADRPVDISLGRVIAKLSWPQTIRVTWKLLTDKEIVTKEDVERYKKSDLIEELMAELAGTFPAIKEVFVRERDLILTHSFQMICANSPYPARVVAVVGIGHCDGIISNWGKVTTDQIETFMIVPPPSLSTKLIKFTLKASVIGAGLYVGYKLIPIPKIIPQMVKSILKVSVAH